MGKQYTIQAPDGKTLTLEGPDNASEEEVIAQAQKLYQPQTNPAGTLDYKRETARQQFEANKPVPTAATGLQSLGEGVMEGLHSAVSGIGGLVKAGLTGDASTLANAVKGAPGAVAQGVTGPPVEYVKALMRGDPDAAAHAGGRILTDTVPAVYGGARLGQEAVQAGREALAGGKTGLIEQRIAPRGREAQAVTAKIAPRLAQDPQYVRVKNALFDQRLFEGFKGAQAELKAAEMSVPRGTVIQKAPILSELDKAISDLQVPAQPIIVNGQSVPQTISGHPAALTVLGDARNELAKLPDQIPFEDLLKYRRQLDQSIQTHGGWKETANAADQAAMQAKRTVANAIRNNLRGISPELDAANQAYSTHSDAMASAGLDWDTGRRISNVGKPTMAQRAINMAGRAAIPTGILAGGYELWKGH